MAHEALEKAGIEAEFKTYKYMGHSACDKEMGDVEAFITSVLGGGKKEDK